MTVQDAIALLKANGYRVSKPKPKHKDRVGPTFVATFADGQVTRMSTYTDLAKLDVDRGMRLARAAYESRTKRPAAEIVAASFERDGQMLASYDFAMAEAA